MRRAIISIGLVVGLLFAASAMAAESGQQQALRASAVVSASVQLQPAVTTAPAKASTPPSQTQSMPIMLCPCGTTWILGQPFCWCWSSAKSALGFGVTGGCAPK